MKKCRLGHTGLMVTKLGYGAMELRHIDQNQAERLLKGVLEAGINFIDTSPDYGPSEDWIGKFISGQRDEYYLATKCGCNVPYPVGENTARHIWTGAQVRHNIEHSLQRLRTDHIDVWQVHSAEAAELASSDVLETMLRIKEEGKVGHIAVSISGRAQVLAPSSYGRVRSHHQETADHVYGQLQPYLDGNWEVLEALQIWYSALNRGSEQAMMEAERRGMGLIIRGVVRCLNPWTDLEDFACQIGLNELRGEKETIAQFLLRFALTHPALDTAIIGTKSLAHLKQNIQAVETGPLAKESWIEAKERLDQAGIKSLS